MSFSEFKTWRNCSAAGRFKYVDRLPSKPRTYLDFGNAIHRAVEDYFESRLKSGCIGQASRSEIKKAVVKAESMIRSLPSLREGREKHLELADALIRSYLEMHGGMIPLFVETMIEASIGGLKIRGKPDLIATDETGLLRVIDYKTAKNQSSSISNDQRLQLTFYRLLAREALGWKIDAGAIHLFAKQKKTVLELPVSLQESDERLLLHQLVGVVETIRTGIVFPNRGAEFCSKKFCDFANTCERAYGGTISE